MRKNRSRQIIDVDFEFTTEALNTPITTEMATDMEEQIAFAIDFCNMNFYAEIYDMEIIEGGLASDYLNDYIEDGIVGVSMMFECYVELSDDEGLDGIKINAEKFKQQIMGLDYIGQYVIPESIRVAERDYDDLDYVEEEPDWDSMPGGNDYYDD